MTEASMWITNRFGEKLEALMRKPKGRGTFPAVLLVQGLGMDFHEYHNAHDEISKRFVKAGLLTVQFNFSYQQFVTETTDREISLEKRAQQVEDVLHWLFKHPRVDHDRVGVYAMSFGVSTVLLAQLLHVRSLCLVGGIGFRQEKFIHRYTSKGAVIKRDEETKLPRSSGKILIVDPNFWPSFDALHQEDLVKHLRIPVLVIHGDQDTYVDTKDMQQVFDAIESKQKKLKIFVGGDHGITDVPRSMREEFLEEVVSWFKETL